MTAGTETGRFVVARAQTPDVLARVRNADLQIERLVAEPGWGDAGYQAVARRIKALLSDAVREADLDDALSVAAGVLALRAFRALPANHGELLQRHAATKADVSREAG